MRAFPLTTLLLPLVALFMPPAVMADSTAAAGAAQRLLFRAVMDDARDGALRADDPRLDALRGYPLYEYITAATLRQQLDAEPGAALDQRIAAFIGDNPDLPPAQRLRDPWLES